MKILLFRSNNIFDSRVNKYRNFFKRASLNHTIVGWDRNQSGVKKENYDFYRFKAGEAVGGMRAIINHFYWMKFVFTYLLKNRSEVTTIHACDLNSAFPAAVFKLLFKKRAVLIFDACDWFSSNFASTKLLKHVFGVMEHFTYKMADELIICEPERNQQIQFKLSKPALVLPNIPEIDGIQLSDQSTDNFTFPNNYPTIAYLGGFSDNRFLAELISLTHSEKFNLLIAGYGDSSIIKLCESASKLENVKYFGRLNSLDGLNMEKHSDIIYAMYCKTNPNNIFAAPNKYYEALFLGKPLITTKGTIVEPKVTQNNIGWAIEENIEELKTLIRNIRFDDIREKGRNASYLWTEKFQDYIHNFFNTKYINIIK